MRQLIDEYIHLIADTLSYVKSRMGEDISKPEKPVLASSPDSPSLKTPSFKKEVSLEPEEKLSQEKKGHPHSFQKEKWVIKETLRQSDDPVQDLKVLLSKIAPQYRITPTVLDDSLGKRKANEWKYKTQAAPITIFIFRQRPEERKLLENIARATETYFAPTRLISAEEIEKQQRWDAFFSSDELKWIITCDDRICQLKSLMTLYKELPSSSEAFLNDVPLFILPDLSLYLKNPILKRSLWKAICTRLCKLLPSS